MDQPVKGATELETHRLQQLCLELESERWEEKLEMKGMIAS